MSPIIVALVGNPNVGKSTLFNVLTGESQQVGNWCGVTVEQKSGFCQEAENVLQIVDLPGCYSYSPVLSDGALDGQIVYEYLSTQPVDLVINVIDAVQLKRHLYLTLQLLEQGFLVIIALNRMDKALCSEIEIDPLALARYFGCPIIPICAATGDGVGELKKAALARIHSPRSSLRSGELPYFGASSVRQAETVAHLDPEIGAAQARYAFIDRALETAIIKRNNPVTHSWTARIDKLVLNRVLGIPLFLVMMYVMFFFTIQVAGIFQECFDIASKAIFVDGMERALAGLSAPRWLVSVMAFGIGQGINITVSFIPVLAGMFLSLAFLEGSGYMSRTAFVMDKVMQWAGLPGKSFIPMIIGFGCNVPAVMAARTLESSRDRILTILMTPFMSCGARLAIYAVFVSAFFPKGGENIIFGLYMIGILVALITGLVLRTTVLRGEQSALMIELPPYRWPKATGLLKTVYHRLKHFLLKAGLIIIPLCTCIAILAPTPHRGEGANMLEKVGRFLTPVFSPMGIQEDNWPATVGLVTGVLAKEVVVGTLSALYSQEKHSIAHTKPARLQEALESVYHNAFQIGAGVWHPLSMGDANQTLEREVLGTMVMQFGSTAAAFSYLLFVLLYFPCVSVIGAIAKELNRSWALFAALWTTGIAYSVSVLFYQSAGFRDHPIASIGWIVGISSVLGVSFWVMRRSIRSIKRDKAKRLPTEIVIA